MVAAAIKVLDEEGLDKLSLRRLARELGVAAPALYWHFRDKQELLDQMVVTMAGDNVWLPPQPGEPWDAWLAERARRQRVAMLAHRDSARLAAGTRPTAALFPLIDDRIGTLAEAGFTPGQALRAVLVVSSYVTGFVLDEQAEAARESEEADQVSRAAEIAFRDALTTGRLPNLLGAFAEVGDPNDERGFEYGLGLLIDGMRAQLARNRSGEPVPPGPDRDQTGG